jgi:hypothetical protein
VPLAPQALIDAKDKSMTKDRMINLIVDHKLLEARQREELALEVLGTISGL